MIAPFLTPADDQAFKDWMQQHWHDGFYLNEKTTGTIRRGKGTMIMHMVGCKHLGAGEGVVSTTYAKVASVHRDELRAWAHEQELQVVSCRSCRRHWDEPRSASDVSDDILPEEDAWFSSDDYLQVLRLVADRISADQRAMLKAHAEAPNHTLSVRELAAAAGATTENFTYSVYGRLGRLVGTALMDASDLPRDPNDPPIWTRVLGEDVQAESDNMVTWVMHPELVEALIHLGWATPSPTSGTLPPAALGNDSGDPFDRPTGREARVIARIGQEEFRARLIHSWQTCAVTGVATLAALRASHIKPWAASTDQERRDPLNGLLLVATLDALFDGGLISFADDGHILIAAHLSVEEQGRLHLDATMRLRTISAGHRPYLAYHRDHVYQESSAGGDHAGQ
jgi:hypothetical protein